METSAILSRIAGLRRSAAVAAVAAVLGTAAPAVAAVDIPAPPAAKPAKLLPVVWRWNGYRWVWVGRRYYGPPVVRPVRRWIAGHWARGPAGWYWVPPHWG